MCLAVDFQENPVQMPLPVRVRPHPAYSVATVNKRSLATACWKYGSRPNYGYDACVYRDAAYTASTERARNLWKSTVMGKV